MDVSDRTIAPVTEAEPAGSRALLCACARPREPAAGPQGAVGLRTPELEERLLEHGPVLSVERCVPSVAPLLGLAPGVVFLPPLPVPGTGPSALDQALPGLLWLFCARL